MEQYITNGQEITNLTTAKEGNALIMRKGKTSLLASKIMLFALLKIENRTDVSFDQRRRQYYNNLQSVTTVDYSKGLVAEMDVSDLRKLLKKENSGSFYSSLRDLFDSDYRSDKSIRSNFAVIMPKRDSGVLGYAEIITACHYDTSCGKLFLKFSDEEYIKSQLWQIKSEYTSLPLLLFLSLKSSHSYRLLELIYAQVSIADEALRKNGETTAPEEYTFRFSVGELQFMLGIIDISSDKEARAAATERNPDWNSLADVIGQKQRSNFQNYKVFRRNGLDVAIKEINNSNADFIVEYSPERDKSGKRISFINFFVKRKNTYCKKTDNERNNIDNMDVIVEIARELSDLSLTYNEINKIAMASNFDKSLVVAAYELYVKFGVSENFSEWFINFRK